LARAGVGEIAEEARLAVGLRVGGEHRQLHVLVVVVEQRGVELQACRRPGSILAPSSTEVELLVLEGLGRVEGTAATLARML
jgi:hypothetical protein